MPWSGRQDGMCKPESLAEDWCKFSWYVFTWAAWPVCAEHFCGWTAISTASIVNYQGNSVPSYCKNFPESFSPSLKIVLKMPSTLVWISNGAFFPPISVLTQPGCILATKIWSFLRSKLMDFVAAFNAAYKKDNHVSEMQRNYLSFPSGAIYYSKQWMSRYPSLPWSICKGRSHLDHSALWSRARSSCWVRARAGHPWACHCWLRTLASGQATNSVE